ncbi:MAG: VWA-like domain-containing protein [Aquificaceae bacterium]|nr:VWA-like domain-containing protein [Aquificaceae bacterium]
MAWSAEDVLIGGVSILLSQVQVLSLLTAKTKFVREDSVGTLAIKPDLTILYNEEFILENAEYAPGLIFHELLHKVYDSFGRFEVLKEYYPEVPKSVKKKIWDIATDCAINQIINASLAGPDDSPPLPTDHVGVKGIENIIKRNNPDFLKSTEIKPFRSAEYYYHLLMQALEEKLKDAEALEFVIEISTLDNHDISMEEFQKIGKSSVTVEVRQDKGAGSGDMLQEALEEKTDSAEGGDKSSEVEVIRHFIEKGISEAIKRRQAGKGSLGADIPIDLSNLDRGYPQLYSYMKNLLRRMISEQTLILNKSRIAPWSAYNVYIGLSQGKPYMIEHPYKRKFKLNLTLIVDTSGSMTTDDIKEFWRSIYPTLTAFHRSGDVRVDIRYMEADDKVVEDLSFDFRGFSDYVKYKTSYKGGGGTDYYDAFEKAFNIERKTDKPHIIVYFTDGYCPDAENVRELIEKNPNTQVIFAICSNGVTSFVEGLKDTSNVHITTFEKATKEEDWSTASTEDSL